MNAPAGVPPSPTSKPTESGLGSAADRLRDAARWLIIAFGALVAVVFAGISVSGLGSLDPETAPVQFMLAIGGAVLALIGAIVALLVAVSLAAAGTIAVGDIAPPRGLPKQSPARERAAQHVRAELRSDPDLSPWGGDVSKFFDDARAARRKYRDRFVESTNVQDAETARLHQALLKLALQRQIYFSDLQIHIINNGSYIRLHYQFGRAKWQIAVSLTLATIGAAMFVWSSGQGANESVPTALRHAMWYVPTDSRSAVQRQLGAACAISLDAVPVVAIGQQGDGAEFDIVTQVPEACQPVRVIAQARDITWSSV